MHSQMLRGRSSPFLTGGEAHDCPVAERLIRRVKPSKHLLGDKAYDSAALRGELCERGSRPVIPNKSSRKQPFSFNNRLYKLRWRIENAFNRLKGFQAHRNALRQARTQLSGLSIQLGSRACMVDLKGLDPSSSHALLSSNALRCVVDDQRVAFRPICAVHCVEAHSPIADMNLQPITVMLQLMRPP